MKIGIEAQRIFRKKKHGMDIFVLQLIKNLQRLDKENDYFIFVKPGPDMSCIQETKNFKIVEVPGITYLDWEQVSLPIAAWAKGIDVLHCTSNTAPLCTHVPTIITIHDVIYLSDRGAQNGTFYQRLGHYYRKWIVPLAARRARCTVTVSNYERTIMSRYLDASKLTYIYNGVSDHFYQHTTVHPSTSDFIFFLGNMAHKKNMTNMLKAYAEYLGRTMNPKPLVIAETSEEQLMGLLRKENIEHIRPHIELTGYVDQKDLPALYQDAALFVYPSLRESFGIPILEAMASGTPVITSAYASMPEVAGDSALLVESKDHKKLADAISTVLGSESLQESMRMKGLRRAKKFQWINASRSYLSIYRSIRAGRTEMAA